MTLPSEPVPGTPVLPDASMVSGVPPTPGQIVAALRDAETLLYSGPFRAWVRAQPEENRQTIIDLRGNITLEVNRLVHAIVAGQVAVLVNNEAELKTAADHLSEALEDLQDFVKAVNLAGKLLSILVRVAKALA